MESETSQKLIPLSSCLLCASSTRRLHSFTQNKAMKESYREVVEKFLGVKIQKRPLMTGLKLCEVCYKKCSAALAFQKDALVTYNQQIQSMDFAKRLSETPPSALEENTVVENLLITDTVENTSSSKDSQDCLMSVNDEPEDELLPSQCVPGLLFDHGYTRSIGGVDITHDSCDFGVIKLDHDYCLITEDLETKDQDELQRSISAINSYTLSNELKELDTQLKKLCQPGASVLWQRNPEVLRNDNCFAKAVIELKCNCPLLLHVLATCLGQYICDKNKVVMIGTIYGIILHARNKQISALQRIYTALAIHYKADN
ncbi:uncharacterized protein LOC134253227 [Saccostrea cucullata]|uniref:uncharacterized protein LOC134253227 n=1 Tax=Saccostrea cuccullata TaxID=36930 RepID=UPI002ED14546